MKVAAVVTVTLFVPKGMINLQKAIS